MVKLIVPGLLHDTSIKVGFSTLASAVMVTFGSCTGAKRGDPDNHRSPASRAYGSDPGPDHPYGSTGPPPFMRYTPKWRCGPVAVPVIPEVPMTWPRAT